MGKIIGILAQLCWVKTNLGLLPALGTKSNQMLTVVIAQCPMEIISRQDRELTSGFAPIFKTENS